MPASSSSGTGESGGGMYTEIHVFRTLAYVKVSEGEKGNPALNVRVYGTCSVGYTCTCTQ